MAIAYYFIIACYAYETVIIPDHVCQ